jgi:catechol 2,3-dioxygenase-like lactoylglutathione lyase family enzyme
MARILEQANVLLVRDVPSSIAYWRDKLGFAIAGVWGEPPDFAILKRDGVRVMLGEAKAEAVITPYWHQRDGLWNAYFWVDNARALFDEMKASGARIDYEPQTQPYGVLEFGVQDLDGHDIGFGQDMDAKPTEAV